MTEYMNRDTGEVLTYEQMLERWREEYDGGDDTSVLEWDEQYQIVM